MAAIGDIILRLLADTKEFGVTVEKDAKKSGDKAGATLGKSMAASLKKSWNGQELGKGLVQGLGFAGALGGANALAGGLEKVTDFIGDSISKASDLNETVSKSNVIFDENAQEMEDWGATAAKNFGQSKKAALDTASTFGGLFQTVGLTLDDATAKSKKLTELGSDLASFFNTDVAEATQALRSGLSGESEPLRRFNVFLSESAVSAKAAQLGLKKTNGEFTEAQKVTARYALILDQTTKAQGDFARTADGLANSQRTANAELEDAQAVLGQKLLPIQLEFTQALADVIPLIGGATDALGLMADAATFLLNPQQLVINKQREMAEAEADRLRAEAKAKQAAIEAANALNTTANTLDDVADRGGRAYGTLATDSEKSARRQITASGRIKRNLLSDLQATVTNYFDILINKDRLAATESEIAANRRILASATATKAEKDDATEALHQLGQDKAQLLQDLAGAGATASTEYQTSVKGLLKDLKTAHGKERDMILAEIAALKLLAQQAAAAKGNIVALTLGKGGYVSGAGAGALNNGRATGGPVTAGVPYVVGERRPELFVPEVDGRIIPRVPSMQPVGAGVGGDTYNVNLLDRMEVRSVRDIGSGLRMLGEQGYLKPRRG